MRWEKDIHRIERSIHVCQPEHIAYDEKATKPPHNYEREKQDFSTLGAFSSSLSTGNYSLQQYNASKRHYALRIVTRCRGPPFVSGLQRKFRFGGMTHAV